MFGQWAESTREQRKPKHKSLQDFPISAHTRAQTRPTAVRKTRHGAANRERAKELAQMICRETVRKTENHEQKHNSDDNHDDSNWRHKKTKNLIPKFCRLWSGLTMTDNGSTSFFGKLANEVITATELMADRVEEGLSVLMTGALPGETQSNGKAGGSNGNVPPMGGGLGEDDDFVMHDLDEDEGPLKGIADGVLGDILKDQVCSFWRMISERSTVMKRNDRKDGIASVGRMVTARRFVNLFFQHQPLTPFTFFPNNNDCLQRKHRYRCTVWHSFFYHHHHHHHHRQHNDRLVLKHRWNTLRLSDRPSIGPNRSFCICWRSTSLCSSYAFGPLGRSEV